MSKRRGRADVRLVSEIGPADESSPVDKAMPFMIGVLGEFTDHRLSNKGQDSASGVDREPIEIDRDNFDAVMKRLGVRCVENLDISLGQEGEPRSVQLAIEGIDSFHPDAILKQLEPLDALLVLRRALEDPANFAAAAVEIRQRLKLPDATSSLPPSSTSANLLERILEKSSPTAAPLPRKDRMEDIARLVHEAVSAHAVRLDVKQQQQLSAVLEKVLGDQLRAILHHGEFQRLEAAWRALHFLVMNCETGPELKIVLLDVSKGELEIDLTNSMEIEDSGVFKGLSSLASRSGVKWGALIGNHDFTMASEDVHLLERIAQIAHRLRAPFVAAAGPRFFGTDSFADLPSAKSLAELFEAQPYLPWRAFRKSLQAQYVGLLLPRFLLRLPYGSQTDPIGAFSFEEGVGGENHYKYLWGNPAFAFAIILTRKFGESGWSLNPARLVGQLDGMPLHVYEAGGLARVQPCAEAVLSDEVVEVLIEEGFMPLVCYRNRDAILIPRAQSVATPPAFLAGHW